MNSKNGWGWHPLIHYECGFTLAATPPCPSLKANLLECWVGIGGRDKWSVAHIHNKLPQISDMQTILKFAWSVLCWPGLKCMTLKCP